MKSSHHVWFTAAALSAALGCSAPKSTTPGTQSSYLTVDGDRVELGNEESPCRSEVGAGYRCVYFCDAKGNLVSRKCATFETPAAEPDRDAPADEPGRDRPVAEPDRDAPRDEPGEPVRDDRDPRVAPPPAERPPVADVGDRSPRPDPGGRITPPAPVDDLVRCEGPAVEGLRCQYFCDRSGEPQRRECATNPGTDVGDDDGGGDPRTDDAPSCSEERIAGGIVCVYYCDEKGEITHRRCATR